MVFSTKRLVTYLLMLSMLIGIPVYAETAPDFSLQGRDGQVNLKDFRGQVVYLDFWASWCVPCRKSFPWMNEVHDNYKGKGLKVIAINLDSSRKAADKFLKQIPAKFIIAFDPDGKTPGQYGLEVMPTSYLIDRNGQVVDIHRGFKKSHTTKMEDKIKQLLATK